MELYFTDLIGISLFSLLFYLYLVLTGQKDYTMRFVSVYCFVAFAVSVAVQQIVKEQSFVQMLCKTLMPVLFAVAYPIAARHKLSRKEINLLVFILFVGIIPMLITWLITCSFWLFGQNM